MASRSALRAVLRSSLSGALLLLCSISWFSLDAQEAPPPEVDEPRALFAMGAQLQHQLGMLGLSDEELERVIEGLRATREGRSKIDLRGEVANLRAFQQARLRRARDAERSASLEFAKTAAAEEGAKQMPSGLIYRELEAGDGESPAENNTVKVHYRGTLRDGTVFDSSIERGEPATFPLQGVIKCWTEGVQLMKVGEKAKLTCPASIAYGERGSPPLIRPGATLSFEVELLEIVN